MAQKRLRIFAGPNGSGKSTFIEKIQNDPPSPNIKLGFYVNADEIEKIIKKTHSLPLKQFGILSSTKQIQYHFKKSTFAPLKLKNKTLWENFTVDKNYIKIDSKLKINSYVAADIADFIREELLKSGKSFSFETVMSDKNKIAFLRKCKKQGYRIYLYFFATQDPSININRVKLRVAQSGHSVKEDVIRKRYYKSLENLRNAVKVSDRAYLFDNSHYSILISEIANGKKVHLIDPKKVPYWFRKYLIDVK